MSSTQSRQEYTNLKSIPLIFGNSNYFYKFEISKCGQDYIVRPIYSFKDKQDFNLDGPMFFKDKNTLLIWMKTYMKNKNIYDSDDELDIDDDMSYFLRFNTGGIQTSLLEVGSKITLKDETMQLYIDLIGEINIIEE